MSDMPEKITAIRPTTRSNCWMPGFLTFRDQHARYVRADIADDMRAQLKRNAQGLRNLLDHHAIVSPGDRVIAEKFLSDTEEAIAKAEAGE